MAIPGYQEFMLPLLRMAGDGQEHTPQQTVELLADLLRLTASDRQETLAKGANRLANRIGWAQKYLTRAGLLKRVRKGCFQITDAGQALLAKNPPALDTKFLETNYPEIRDFLGKNPAVDDEPPATFDEANRSWVMRGEAQARLSKKVDRAVGDPANRRGALELLAFVIENADEERSDGWCVRETHHGLAVMAGRLVVCKLTRRRMELSVIGPIADEIRTAIGADRKDDDEFKWIPGGVILRFPVERAADALRLLSEEVNSFVDLAMARVRRAVDLEDHLPEGVALVAESLGRELPQPIPAAEALKDAEDDPSSDEGEEEASREPQRRGRAPIFEHSQRAISTLLDEIDRGVIALPDLQRPFVWEDTKVRDLLDSLFLGFPVGTLVLWHTSSDKEARAVGADRAALRANTLVIDGQQRLTSLAAAVGGKEIIDKDGEKRRIVIAFRPRDGRFEVTDAAIRNDPEFVPNVTEIWTGPREVMQIRRELLAGLRDKGRPIDEQYEYAVEWNLSRAQLLREYRFPTVEIRSKSTGAHGGEASEEDVGEIFVRINNQGTRLGQADFVLTLLSVFHGQLRDRFEERARAMSQGPVITVDTQQLLRAACAVAFGRARMSAIYKFLRGVDPSTGEADPTSRAKRLDELDEAARKCLEKTPWSDYLLRVQHAGFLNHRLIASRNAVVNAYAFYVRGLGAGVDRAPLGELISRWLFASLLTARYSGSSETMFEQDLGRVDRLEGDGAFVRALDEAIGESLTGDYWTRTLVAALETQKARSPAALAFRAAQVVLGTRALFSDQLLQNLLAPPAEGGRSASEAHHLFPEAFLRSRGVGERRRINQVANLADVGWHDNNIIGGHSPAQYVPRLRDKLRIDDDRWGRMCAEHALPPGWERMDYDEFLVERRQRMAEIVRVAFRKLGGEAEAQAVTPPWFLPGSEAVWQRLASTERALRAAIREVYSTTHRDLAALRITETLSEPERQSLERALRHRPAGADPLSVVDYLTLGQLPNVLFAASVWPAVQQRYGWSKESRQKLRSTLDQLIPVRNAIAHVREVEQNALLRATVAAEDIATMLRPKSGPES